MGRLVDNVYLSVDLDERTSLLRYTRHNVPFATFDEVHASFGAMQGAIEALDRAREYRLLMDVREGPARNDPAFEEVIASYRKAFWGRFTRRAILVKTAAGALQIRRLEGPTLPKGVGVFMDEAEALAFLSGR